MRPIGFKNLSSKNLPYDVEIEYIGSKGGETSEYINVGIIPSTQTRCKIKCANTKGYTSQIIGSSGGEYQYYQCAFYGNGLSLSPGASYDKIELGLVLNTPYEIDFNCNSSHDVLLDGTKIGITTAQPNGNLWIFRRGQSGIPSYVNLYSMQIYQDFTNLIFDLIPVRKDGVGYMYDRVSGQLFGNSGTRNFILGPDK